MHRLARAMTVLAAVVAASPALATDAEETAAETWFTDYATRRFGPPEAAYIHCANFFTTDDGGRVGDCWAHFKSGIRWHQLVAGVQLEDQNVVGIVGQPFHRAWTRKWRRASRTCMKQTVDPLPLKGKLISNDGACDARLAMEIYKGQTFLHGTGTASFGPVAAYRCRERRRTQSCFNSVGDGFRYTFPRLLRCGNEAAGQGWTIGKIEGAGKYNLTTSKVQCTSARMFVDNLKYGRPFRTGVTWTAHTRYSGTYRCTYLDVGYESVETRCTAPRGRVLHWEEGA